MAAWPGFISLSFQLQIPILYGDNKKTHGPTNIKLKVSRRAASDHALDAGAQCGLVEQCLGAVPNAVSEGLGGEA